MEYEKLGVFYLGKEYDLAAGEMDEAPILYDSRDLTTHGICIGMTGSGKTGLAISLLEEAAIDGVPIIAIDPKGDLGNMLLTFPDLAPEDFEPWVDPAAAQRKGQTTAEYAKGRADLWRNGLASWDQDGARIQRLRDKVDLNIYTPGSSQGRPLAVLRSFDPPTGDRANNRDARQNLIDGAVNGLLALLQIDADPLRSREYLLLCRIVDHAWSEGRSLPLGDLIRQIQSPPFEKIGVFDLESFYPEKERFELALSVNGVLASPGFEAWLDGDPLEIPRLLRSPDGKPRVSILSIAHLSETERMFFVTLLLNEVLSWVRTQPGTSSLRAIIYMDEIYGYFPPTANPPSKQPMLTLLKQARAHGVGVLLSTQNPVDLDYKGLSNTGTWFIGRLQTERDKLRVLEGLEGADGGGMFDRQRMEQVLAGLGSRVFLMHNVHDDGPVIFHTRWAMSFLSGPMTLPQIASLSTRESEATAPAKGKARKKKKQAKKSTRAASALTETSARPMLAPGIEERFLRPTRPAPAGTRVLYRPGVTGTFRLHFVRASAKLDEWREVDVLLPLAGSSDKPLWDGLLSAPGGSIDGDPSPNDGFTFGAVGKIDAKGLKGLEKELRDHLYRERNVPIWKCKRFRLTSSPGEDHETFLGRVQHAAREKRDEQLAKLEERYKKKLATIEDRIRKAERRLEKENEDVDRARSASRWSIGTSLIGALFGKRLSGVRSAARSTRKTSKEKQDVRRAEEVLEEQQEKFAAMEEEFRDKVSDLELDAEDLPDVDETLVRPRKSDISSRIFCVAWVPHAEDPNGHSQPLIEGSK
ncbi:MAG: DUF87 domain-containing protein [Planctomycetota bacterium]